MYKQLTNEELHKIRCDEPIKFINNIVYILIPVLYKCTPEGGFEISRLVHDLSNVKSFEEIENVIYGFLGCKCFNELVSLLYRVIIPMGVPFETSGQKSLGIIDEIIFGFRIPYNVLSDNKKPNINDKRFLYINGIGCDINIHNNNISTLDEFFNVSFDGVYNPTHSIPTDVLTVITQYFTDSTCNLLFKCIINYFYSAVDASSITIVAHSKGTITIGYVIRILIFNIIIPGYLKNATKEQRDTADICINIIMKMRIYALSNCALSNNFLKIGDKYFPEFYSFCNTGDPVPTFGRLGDLYLQYYADMEHISRLAENNIDAVREDEIMNLVDPLSTRETTRYLDKLFTLDKGGHLLHSYLFRREQTNYNQDYFYEVFTQREGL
jgi:hypothetical protein